MKDRRARTWNWGDQSGAHFDLQVNNDKGLEGKGEQDEVFKRQAAQDIKDGGEGGVETDFEASLTITVTLTDVLD